MATPTVPTLIKVAALGPSQVDLHWTATYDSDGDADAGGYKIYRNGALLATLGPSGPQKYQDLTAVTNTTYYYQVTAYDLEANESNKSNFVYVTTPLTPAAQDNLDYVQGRKDIYARLTALES